MKIAIGSDHAGYELKSVLKKHLKEKHPDFEIFDCGCDGAEEPVDYPVYAFKVANYVARKVAERGILICGTGIGMCISANKVKGIRAANIYDVTTATLSYSHNMANIICLGARLIPPSLAIEIVETYLSTSFNTENGRHLRRIRKIHHYELNIKDDGRRGSRKKIGKDENL